MKAKVLTQNDKRNILEGANYTCTKCGVKGKPSTQKHRYLVVHHKDINVCNNEPDNLEVLCQRCHVRHHLNRDLGLVCLKCNSDRIVKVGFKITRGGRLQRYQCQSCGHVFVNERR